jgi:hypothetical protein
VPRCRSKSPPRVDNTNAPSIAGAQMISPLAEGQFLRGGLHRIPVRILRSPFDVVDVLSGHGERNPQSHQGFSVTQLCDHPLGRCRHATQMPAVPRVRRRAPGRCRSQHQDADGLTRPYAGLRRRRTARPTCCRSRQKWLLAITIRGRSLGAAKYARIHDQQERT